MLSHLELKTKPNKVLSNKDDTEAPVPNVKTISGNSHFLLKLAVNYLSEPTIFNGMFTSSLLEGNLGK